ncbi:MAG: rhodanese-like domain-containing protein [Terriglobales bacterium]
MAETYGTVTREELKAKLDAKDMFTLIETLPKAAYEDAHLPEAINIPLEDLRIMVPRLVPSTWSEIVVYCASPT